MSRRRSRPERWRGGAVYNVGSQEVAGSRGESHFRRTVRAHNSRNVLDVFGIGRSLLDKALIESSNEQMRSLGLHMEDAPGSHERSVEFITHGMLVSRGSNAAAALKSYRASREYKAAVSESDRQVTIGKFFVRGQLVVRRVIPDEPLRRCEIEPLLRHCMPGMSVREVSKQRFFLPVGHLDSNVPPADTSLLLDKLDAYHNSSSFSLVEAALGPLQVQSGD